jgi:hypothetical protein
VVDVCAIAAPPGATCATAATQTTMLRTVMRISQSPQREIRTDRIRNCRALRPKTYGVLRIAQGRIEGRNCRASDCPAKHHAHLRIDAKTAHPFRMRRLLNSLPLDYSSSPSSLAIPGGLAAPAAAPALPGRKSSSSSPAARISSIVGSGGSSTIGAGTETPSMSTS